MTTIVIALIYNLIMDEDKKTRMAGDKLATRKKRQEYRDSLQNDDEARAARLDRITFNDGLEALPDDYDDKLVAQALRGGWGDEDLARYNELVNGGGGNDDKDPEDTETPDPGTGGGGTNTGGGGDINIGDSGPKFGPITIAPSAGQPGGQVQAFQQDNSINQTIGAGATVTNKNDYSVSQQSAGYSAANKHLNRFMQEYDFFK